ncbi:putative acyl-CoA dehydrogenase FadE [Actinoplanes lobatus]|uniref:Acyl-CoA dehydrogenase FadE n=1 Tax=Actinoplanes lobatus TaxID=113568 RepID=A0A7W7HQP6_9ACTN|nr:acyl-CoA dehydrogenase [Actinoplanes lobatus]MBB4754946.1 alkylation response protein AidB-like acyl-CoA dehydrogenase [Actinoplanes lobatus]GGN82942.1 putative acyl-CoA dehydrogenase FadE [Actinoplanes lobatus]GIE40735.1 putative acyl-CoA dehydrogenase FadE [Actinoplanes lobatus]
MRLAPSTEQLAFAAALHGLLAAADLPKVSTAWADGDPGAGRALWSALAGAGVTGLLVPERWGGQDAGPDDLIVACEELGHHAVPGPLAESIAAVPALLTAAATRPGPREWLAALAEGRLMASLVAPPWLPFAADGDSADLILVADGDEIRQGHARSVLPSLNPARRLSEVTPGELIASGQDPGRAMELGVLACSAQLLGAARALLERSVDHAKQRAQFGRPIGAFQAVRHQLADVAVAIEFAQPLLYAAAVALKSGCGPLDVSAAKVACGEAARLAARVALQVHGAVGYTREHGLWRWLGLVRVLDLAWGTPSWHRARILTGLAGAGTSVPEGGFE